MRYIPYKKLVVDDDGKVLGFFPQAFELREDEEALSVNWLEHFKGDYVSQVAQSVKAFRDSLSVGTKSAFGIATVHNVTGICNSRNKSIRIVYSPEENNSSHSLIKELPKDDLKLLEALALEFFPKMVLNSEIK